VRPPTDGQPRRGALTPDAALLATTVLTAAGLAVLAMAAMTADALLGGPRLDGGHGVLSSDLFVGADGGWARLLAHNLASLAAFAAAPLAAAGVQALPVRVAFAARLSRDALLVAAGLALLVVAEEGGVLATLTREFAVSPLRVMPVLADHHGIWEITALLLPTAALITAHRRRGQLRWLVPIVCAISIGLLGVAAVIEAHSTPGAVAALVGRSAH
jgi:hypothetical protein